MSTEPSDAEKIRDALTGTNWSDLATAPWVKVEHLLLLLEALHFVRSFDTRALLRVSLAVTRSAFEALPPTDVGVELRGRNLIGAGIIESVAWLESDDVLRDTRDAGRMGTFARWTLHRGQDDMKTPTDHVATALLFVVPVPQTIIMEAARFVAHATRASMEVLGEDRTCALLREHLVPLLVSHIGVCEDIAGVLTHATALRFVRAPRDSGHVPYQVAVGRIERDGGTPR